VSDLAAEIDALLEVFSFEEVMRELEKRAFQEVCEFFEKSGEVGH
jgi:hypothetical protein